MICPNCKKEISDNAVFCKFCGNKVETERDKPKQFIFEIKQSVISEKKVTLFGIILVVILIYALTFKCKAGICLLPHNFKGDYCFLHTCGKSNCYNKVVHGKKYCYTHTPSNASDRSYTPEKAENVLSFSDIKISNNSSYTVCNATITNNGRTTYSFIEVKGKFKDSSGAILDTDWTYAVGAEGLSPNESVTFRLSVSKNMDISKCSLEILDYEK